MTRPRLRTEGDFFPGVIAVAIFGVLAAVFLGAALPAPAGFGENAAVMKSIGAALFSIDAGSVVGQAAPVDSEGFLVAFEIVDAVLVAALVGAVMLARREDAGENVTVGADAGASDASESAVAADGGEE